MELTRPKVAAEKLHKHASRADPDKGISHAHTIREPDVVSRQSGIAVNHRHRGFGWAEEEVK